MRYPRARIIVVPIRIQVPYRVWIQGAVAVITVRVVGYKTCTATSTKSHTVVGITISVIVRICVTNDIIDHSQHHIVAVAASVGNGGIKVAPKKVGDGSPLSKSGKRTHDGICAAIVVHDDEALSIGRSVGSAEFEFHPGEV